MDNVHTLCGSNELCKTICPFESSLEKKNQCIQRQNCVASMSQLESKYKKTNTVCKQDTNHKPVPFYHTKFGKLSPEFDESGLNKSTMNMSEDSSSCKSCSS